MKNIGYKENNLLQKSVVNLDLNKVEQELRLRGPYIKYIIRAFLPKNNNIKILDIGCGYGAFLYYLQLLGYEYCQGVDCLSEQIKIAKQIGLKNVCVGDIIDFLTNADNNSYDLILAFDVLEHFHKEEVFFILKQLYRILSDEGKIIVHIPNAEGIFYGSVFYGDLTHKTCFTRSSFQDILNLAGFKDIEFFEESPTIHGLKSSIRYFLWKIIRTIFGYMYMIETGENLNKVILSRNLLAVVQKKND